MNLIQGGAALAVHHGGVVEIGVVACRIQISNPGAGRWIIVRVRTCIGRTASSHEASCFESHDK